MFHLMTQVLVTIHIDNVTGKKLTDAGIDFVLHGHEHAYARTTLKTTSTAGRNR